MDILRYRFLKGIMLPAMVCTLLFAGGVGLLGDDEKVRQLMGPIFVKNNTEYDLKFTVKFPHYKSWGESRFADYGVWAKEATLWMSNYEEISVTVDKNSEKEVNFWSKDDENIYFFGKVGESSEKLVITSEEWPKDERIVIKLRKNKKNDNEFVVKSYEDEIEPFLQKDLKKHQEETLKVIWSLEWNEENDGWLMILEQDKTDTGFILKELDQEL